MEHQNITMKSTNKADIRPCTEFIRNQLRIQQIDKNIEFDLGIKFLELNYKHLYELMSRNKAFWNWFKIQWETRAKLTLDLLGIDPTETTLTIHELNVLLEAYRDTHSIFIKNPSRPSKQLLKTIEKCKITK